MTEIGKITGQNYNAASSNGAVNNSQKQEDWLFDDNVSQSGQANLGTEQRDEEIKKLLLANYEKQSDVVDVKVNGNKFEITYSDGSKGTAVYENDWKDLFYTKTDKTGNTLILGKAGNSTEEAVNNIKNELLKSGHTNIRIEGNQIWATTKSGRKVSYTVEDNGKKIINNLQAENTPGNTRTSALESYKERQIQKATNKAQARTIALKAANLGPIANQLSLIGLTYKSLRDVGAHSVTPMALLAMTKGNGLMKNLNSQINRYAGQINDILNNTSLSEADKASKIKSIERAIKTSQSEAEAKMDILATLTDTLFDVYKFTMQSKLNGSGTYEAAWFIMNMITSVSTGVSNYSDCGSEDQMKEKLNESMGKSMGGKSADSLKEKQDELQEKIENLMKKLEKEDMSEKETVKTQAKIEMYTFELAVISSVIELMTQFAEDKN